MSTISRHIFIIGLMVLTIGCEENFDPNIYSEAIPVVYGLPCPEDTIFQILLTKSFVGQEDVYELATDPENLFFENVEAYLELRHIDGTGIIRKELEWININPQTDGIFNRNPNKVLGISKEEFPLDFNYTTSKPFGFLVLNIKIDERKT